MDSKNEALTNFIATLTPEQAEMFADALREWDCDLDDMIDQAENYLYLLKQIYARLMPKVVNHADAT